MTDAVVITGAGSGIGRACVEALAARGVRIIAGARDDAERDAMEERGDAVDHVLVFDVGQLAEVERAAREAQAHLEGHRLIGVVNSAGIAVAGPLELLPDDALRRQFDVNVFGLMSVSRAFLPRLREDRGRLVQLGSVGGRLSIPFTGAYSGTKFALRGLSDALRVELSPAGVHVALIEPGPIDTPIWEVSLAAADRLLERLGDRARELYGHDIERMRETTRATTARAIPASEVARSVVHALTAPSPRAYYLVGFDARVQDAIGRLPPWARDRLLRRALGLSS